MLEIGYKVLGCIIALGARKRRMTDHAETPEPASSLIGLTNTFNSFHDPDRRIARLLEINAERAAEELPPAVRQQSFA